MKIFLLIAFLTHAVIGAPKHPSADGLTSDDQGEAPKPRQVVEESASEFKLVFECNDADLKKYCEEKFTPRLKEKNFRIKLECKTSDKYRITLNGKQIFPTDDDLKKINAGQIVAADVVFDRIVAERKTWVAARANEAEKKLAGKDFSGITLEITSDKR